ncbi:hypothetical protein VNO80_20337 [Phaseolus coccineus]|uniref:Uncharacterized protein n=1 Tax=Phaseolus coccineus TaxID=3886 RepID=A0AAN9MHR8_PHACN
MRYFKIVLIYIQALYDQFWYSMSLFNELQSKQQIKNIYKSIYVQTKTFYVTTTNPHAPHTALPSLTSTRHKINQPPRAA